MLKRIKEKYNNYLQRLTQANKEAFGGNRPSCCNMHRREDGKA